MLDTSPPDGFISPAYSERSICYGPFTPTSVLRVLDTLPEFDVERAEETLADRIDPDALDSLVRTTDGFPREEG